MSQHVRTPLESHFSTFDTRQQAPGTDSMYRENTLRVLRKVAAERTFDTLTANPLGGLSEANVKADPRRHRRALTEDELDRLLTVALTRPLDAKLAITRGSREGQAGARLSDSTRATLG